MTTRAPKIDERTAADVVRQVYSLLGAYTAEWQNPEAGRGVGFDPARGVSAALVGIFGRFAEIIIQRLNQVPDKNLLAFLNLLGVSLLPPQPARVPLTFALAAGSTTDALVPAGTQAAAPPAAGEQAPVIFETERELSVTPARLDAAFVRLPHFDRYEDVSALMSAAVRPGLPVFGATRQIEHHLYLAHDELFGFPATKKLTVTFMLAQALEDPAQLVWEAWDGSAWRARQQSDQSAWGATGVNQTTFDDFAAVPPTSVNARAHRWLRCRLLTPVTNNRQALDGFVRASQLPVVAPQGVALQARLERTDLRPDGAFFNHTPLDLTKDFFPFGERPKYGDTFYLSSREAFAQPNATVKLNFDLVNPVGSSQTSPPPVYTANNPQLRWEFWNGAEWEEFGTGLATGPVNVPGKFVDNTQALTRKEAVHLVFPRPPAETVVNGVKNYWLRARLVAGNYGDDVKYVKGSGDTYTPNPPTFAPPILKPMRFDYYATLSRAPEAIVTYNDLVYEEVSPGDAFAPFRPTPDARPTFYLGLTLPPARPTLPDRPVTLYCAVADPLAGATYSPVWPARSRAVGAPGQIVKHRFTVTNSTGQSATWDFEVKEAAWPVAVVPPTLQVNAGKTESVEVQVTVPLDAPPGSDEASRLVLTDALDPATSYSVTFVTTATAEVSLQLAWQYWNGAAWAELPVIDGTDNFTRTGLVESLPPPDFVARAEFGLPPRHWLRAVWAGGNFDVEPRLSRLLLNTTMAVQAITITDETLGSSDASINQRFRAARAPVLAGQQLEVREPEVPAAAERAQLAAEFAAMAKAGMSAEAGTTDIVRLVLDAAGRPREIWVRWREVPDFYDSGPRDRHYVLDRQTGELLFGDGLHGLIPPAGAANLRLARYRTGGGRAGNRPAGVITQLKTTVPYVERVVNHEPAAGGADAETTQTLLERAPRAVRHRDRAVTPEDYEDLARLASPAVARAKCVPLYDLAADPNATTARLGMVSLIVVPGGAEARPQPSQELLNRVRDYLDARRLPTAELVVVGPEYVGVSVEVEIGLVTLAGAGEVEAEINLRLARYLHPLSGGLDGAGWDFGRGPHKSDLYALLESVPGVDHVRRLKVVETEERPGAAATGRFLVYSGAHDITLSYRRD
ncbi:MAG TPA: putative baseplate assembly protein [Pyrinomonadaceae bacterium]